MTYITQLNAEVSGGGFPVIQMPTDTEMSLYRSRSLVGWWRPDPDVSIAAAWTDRKAGIATPLVRGESPLVMSGGTNNKPFIRQPEELPTPVYATQEAILPGTDGVTFAWFGKLTAGVRTTVQAVIANAVGVQGEATFAGYGFAGDTVLFRNNATSSFISYPLPNPNDLHFIVASLDYTTKQGVLLVDKVQVASGTSAQSLTSRRVSLLGAYSGSGGIFATSFKGDIYDMWAFGSALHLPQNADQLAVLNAYMSERYGF